MQPLNAEKAEEMDSLLEPPKRNVALRHLDFIPVRLIEDFWPPEL